ncbi:solute carrier family 2 (facilitated glucose transporter), member 13 [Plakobranchus ocellatus]|uniref:Solute carrier family 2 (Facilitated glucose transporter), member 13 n=1 Tax=Plakobranchus ocellatus TaxID=259542 RepID=A0AAV3ZSC1_9GAST|nr:solute carrier family 2 (facilitated glucose transporter), member 13 [Plakobranchus ocellatus]
MYPSVLHSFRVVTGVVPGYMSKLLHVSGVVSSVVPIYVSECSPPDIRGCLITMNQLFITIGIWVSALVAALFQNMDEGWRYMFGIAVIPGLLQFFCFLILPESPRWQVMKDNIQKGRRTLQKIRGVQEVTEELEDIILSLEEEKKTKVHNKVISGFQALRQARTPVAGLEPATVGSLQISGKTRKPLCYRRPSKKLLGSRESSEKKPPHSKCFGPVTPDSKGPGHI